MAARGVALKELCDQMVRIEERERKLADMLSRSEELADAIASDLALLREALGHRGAPSRRVPGRRDGSRPGITLDHVWDGSAVLSVDGCETVRLPPALADLCEVLCPLDGTVSSIYPWKPYPIVQQVLAERVGRRFTRRAVTQLVYRLRQLLASRGMDRNLVQTNRRAGIRLVARRLAVLPP